MPEIKDTKKYTFTVEGETEQWYFDWLEEQINQCETAKCKASIIAKVQQNPSKFAKTQAASATPTITHICDVESNEPVHVQKFKDIHGNERSLTVSGQQRYHLILYRLDALRDFLTDSLLDYLCLALFRNINA